MKVLGTGYLSLKIFGKESKDLLMSQTYSVLNAAGERSNAIRLVRVINARKVDDLDAPTSLFVMERCNLFSRGHRAGLKSTALVATLTGIQAQSCPISCLRRVYKDSWGT